MQQGCSDAIECSSPPPTSPANLSVPSPIVAPPQKSLSQSSQHESQAQISEQLKSTATPQSSPLPAIPTEHPQSLPKAGTPPSSPQPSPSESHPSLTSSPVALTLPASYSPSLATRTCELNTAKSVALLMPPGPTPSLPIDSSEPQIKESLQPSIPLQTPPVTPAHSTNAAPASVPASPQPDFSSEPQGTLPPLLSSSPCELPPPPPSLSLSPQLPQPQSPSPLVQQPQLPLLVPPPTQTSPSDSAAVSISRPSSPQSSVSPSSSLPASPSRWAHIRTDLPEQGGLSGPSTAPTLAEHVLANAPEVGRVHHLPPSDSAPSPKRIRADSYKLDGLSGPLTAPTIAEPVVANYVEADSKVCVPSAASASPQSPMPISPDVSNLESTGFHDEETREPMPLITLPSQQLSQPMQVQFPNQYETELPNISEASLTGITEKPSIAKHAKSDVTLSRQGDKIAVLHAPSSHSQIPSNQYEVAHIEKRECETEVAPENTCVVQSAASEKFTAVRPTDSLSTGDLSARHTQIKCQSTEEGLEHLAASMAQDLPNKRSTRTTDDAHDFVQVSNATEIDTAAAALARRKRSASSSATGEGQHSAKPDHSTSVAGRQQASAEPSCRPKLAPSAAENAQSSTVETPETAVDSLSSKKDIVEKMNEEGEGLNSTPSQTYSIPDKERRKRANNYSKIRQNLRKAIETKDYRKVRFVIKNKALNSEPEPDTLDVLADCLASMCDDRWKKFREQASKLRNDPVYGDGGLPAPFDELGRAIGNTSGDFEDFDLITSPDRSAPSIRQPFLKEVRQADGLMENYLVLILTIQLDLCPGLVIDGVTEVVAEVSELCDEQARPEELKRKEERLRQFASATALNRLKDLVERSHVIRKQLEDDSNVLDEREGISSVLELRNLVSNATGAFELILSRKRSMPRMRTSEEDSGEVNVVVRVDLDVSDWLDFELPDRLTNHASRILPRRMLPEIRKNAIKAITNEAAAKVLSDVKDIGARVVMVAKNTLKKDIKEQLKKWAIMNKNPTYVRTLKSVQKIVCSEKGAGNYGFKLNCFGSMPCELALPGSDLDINITLVPEKYMKFATGQDENETPGNEEFKYSDQMKLGVLRRLEPIVKISGMKQVHLIHARVPLLRFVDPDTDIEVDLTVGNPNGVLLTKFLRYHMRVDRRVWQLSMLIRNWAKQRKISGVVRGYINPLGWTVMVIYFLQHRAFPPIAKLFEVINPGAERVARDVCIHPVRWDSSSKCDVNETPIDELMIEFFKFYKNEFNFGENVISINLQEPAKKSDFKTKELTDRCAITIEQPLVPGKNIVGYVASGNLQETRLQMDIAIFRAVNIGRANAVFRASRDSR